MLRRTTSQGFAFAVLFFLLFSFGIAQEGFKVGVVNSMEVLEKSIEGKRILSQLEQKNKDNQDKIARMDEDIRKLETRLSTQGMTLSNEALIQLRSDLEKKRTERTRFAEDSYREMQELQSRLFTRLQNELIPIIEKIGQDMEMDIIFDLRNSGAIYADPGIDITEEVIKRYDVSKSAS